MWDWRKKESGKERMSSIKEKRKTIQNRRSPYRFIIKLILLALCGYLMIQVSIEAKRIEEKDYLPDMQTTMDYLNKYVRYKYYDDWDDLGHDLRQGEYLFYELLLRANERVLDIIVYQDVYDRESEFWGFMFPANEYKYLLKEVIAYGDDELVIWTAYNGDPHIEIYRGKEGAYTSYNVQYENGTYIPNPDLKNKTGITTEEAVAWAEDIRHIFEEEVERMHVYEVNKSRKTRGRIANIGLFIFLCYMALKWKAARKKVKTENKLMEQCVGEITANTIRKWLRWKYLLLGGGVTFWIYMLRPIFSRFFLFWINGAVNGYTAYVLSAVITLTAAYALCRKMKERDDIKKENGKSAWIRREIIRLFQMSAGCGVMIFFINLSRMYDFFLRAFLGW